MKSMPPAPRSQLQQFIQVRLVDRHLAAAQLLDLLRIGVDAGDAMAQISQAGARYGSHISRSNDRDSHELSTFSISFRFVLP